MCGWCSASPLLTQLDSVTLHLDSDPPWLGQRMLWIAGDPRVLQSQGTNSSKRGPLDSPVSVSVGVPVAGAPQLTMILLEVFFSCVDEACIQ